MSTKIFPLIESSEKVTCARPTHKFSALGPLQFSTSPTSRTQHRSRCDDTIIQFLGAINAKAIKGDQNCFEIDGDEGFTAAIARLEQSDPDIFALFAENKVRYHLFKDKIMVIKMPEERIHSVIAETVSSMIQDRLRDLREHYYNGTDTGALVDKLMRIGTGGILLCNGGAASPDSQFGIYDDPFPGVVLEIANTQPYGGLGGLARKLQNHVVGSDGNIKVALGLEINNRRKPRLSQWVPKIVAQANGRGLLKSEIIVHRELLTEGGNLEIFVKDFVSSNELLTSQFPHLDPTAMITIPFSNIAHAIDPFIRHDIEEKRRGRPKFQLKYDHELELPPLCSSRARTTLSIGRGTQSAAQNQQRSISTLSAYQPRRPSFSPVPSGTRKSLQWPTSANRALLRICRLLR